MAFQRPSSHTWARQQPKLGSFPTRQLRTKLRAAVAVPRRPRLQVAAALQDPWATLGVSRSASEKEIKKAHRQLVKQHHPDVKGGEDALAHAKFLRIQEAYELIMGKRAGKDIESTPASQGSWSFHDWYWRFSMKRRKGPFAAAAAAAEPPPQAMRQQWQAQMAGLRQKAAAKRGRHQVRKGQQQPAPAASEAAAAAAAAAPPPPGGPSSSAAARERVWRSMTKNAKSSGKPAAQPGAAAAQELGAAQQRAVAAGAASQAQQAQQAPQPRQQQRQQQPQQHTPTASPSAATGTGAEPLRHAADVASSGGDPSRNADAGGVMPDHASASAASSSSHFSRLQQLKAQAAAVVQAGGRHLRGHMTLDQLASLLGGQAPPPQQQQQPPQPQQQRRQPEQAGPDGHAAGPAGNVVAADAQLHQRFEATRRQREQQAAADAAAGPDRVPAGSAAAEQQQQQQGPQEQPPPPYSRAYSSHARKFANRDDVEQRLSSQLAGLKRRAALKQEVQSGW